MWTSNNALVPDPDKEDILASKPLDWPFLKLGLRMCGWGDNQIKFYLLGTPIIWWWSTISLGLALLVVGWYAARMQRQYRDWEKGEWEAFLHVGKIAFGCWALHFCKLYARCGTTADICSAFPGDGSSYVSTPLRECCWHLRFNVLTHSSYPHYGSLYSFLDICWIISSGDQRGGQT
jgi:hypothetical protein